MRHGTKRGHIVGIRNEWELEEKRGKERGIVKYGEIEERSI